MSTENNNSLYGVLINNKTKKPQHQQKPSAAPILDAIASIRHRVMGTKPTTDKLKP